MARDFIKETGLVSFVTIDGIFAKPVSVATA